MPLAVVLAVVAGSGSGGREAPGRRLHSYVVRPEQSGVSCLSRRLCVVVGAGARGADVQVVRDGVPGRIFAVRGERTSLNVVSCAGLGGCIAVGSRPRSGPIVYVVRISGAGRPVGLAKLKVPFFTDLLGISCTAVASCEVVGETGVGTPVTGWWNGRSLAVHQLRLPPGVSYQLGEIAVSCWRGGGVAAPAGGLRAPPMAEPSV